MEKDERKSTTVIFEETAELLVRPQSLEAIFYMISDILIDK